MDGIWRKSTTCDGGTCLELALINGDVHIRNPADRELRFSREAWTEFIEGVKLGEFDRPPNGPY